MYRVNAPLVLVRDEAGKTHHCYFGSVVDFVDADHAAYLLETGMLVADDTPSGAAKSVPVRAEDAGVNDSDPVVDLPRPPHVAAKALWIDYAVSQGFGRDEAEAMTKENLIATLS